MKKKASSQGGSHPLSPTPRFAPDEGHSPVLHCAALLRIILRVISARALQNGGFFFAVEPSH